ncbi:ATP-dependent RNA helicase TDRD9-like [Littorina saxatilis]|uniref:RNA helicase n=1 Tax=Littorina saxatilis TaxID=31220 RepID=A0AAN9BKJ7_9CAEN
MALSTEISLDQIDDWFQIGKKATSSSLNGLPAGTLLGRQLDPKTKLAHVTEEPNFDQYYPSYKRQNSSQAGHAQYQEYIRQSQENIEPGGRVSPSDLSDRLDQLDVDSTVCGSVAMPEDFIPEGATAVYDNYSFQHCYDPKLPITRKAEEVILTIESNQVTIIQGSTGSGKTTQVPQFILDHYAAKGEYCNIIVTQPRRIAAVSIAKRVCQERGWPVGSVCGYQIGMDLKFGDDTRLLYCTTGVLREKLINKKNMHQYTHVILDEVHERDQESDFALLVVKKLLRTNSQHVKVILMSATMNSDQFARYFSLPVMDVLEPAPVVNVEGQVFKVSQFFADDLKPLGPVPDFEEGRPMLHPQIVDIAIRLIQEFDKLEIKEQGVDQNTGYATVRGTVLFFLPGLREIVEVMTALRDIEQRHHLTLIPLHSTITIDEQARVFEKPVRGFRKVILSTNIAESSITVPDIKYVIDSCLTKNLVCDLNTNYTHLQLEWASHSNCTQRKGRAGRVSQGRAYFLVTRDFYENNLLDYSLPEMQRCPLETLVLKTKLLDMGEPIALLSQALSPPDLMNIERTILSLKQVGALCITSDGKVKRFDGDLTFVGRVLADLPVDIRVGKLMILGYVFGLLDECIIIGASLSLKSIFATPFQSRLEAFKHKLTWSSGSLSDCQAILHAYKVWEKCKELEEFRRTGCSERQWGEKHFIQTKRINEVHELVRELKQRLEKFNLVKVQPHFDHTQHVHIHNPGELSPKDSLFLKIIMCGAFFPNYFFKKQFDEQDAVRALSNHDPLNTVMVGGLPQNQGVLYRDRLVKMFSVCCPHGHKPTVDCEESRAFIQFPRTDRDTAHTVNPSVCYAVKIRHLRIPLSLEVYDKQATQDMMKLLQDAHEQVASQGFLRTNRVSGAESSPQASSPSTHVTVALPDPSQSVVQVLITEVVNCGHFYAQTRDQRTHCNMVLLTTMLNPVSKLATLMMKPYVGMMCAAPYFDEKESFYRARVEKLEMQNFLIRGAPRTVRVAKVLFVDYGNREAVPVERLKALPPQAVTIPLQAFECELTEIRPSSVKCPDGNWTKEANTVFSSLVMGKVFLAQVFSVVRDVVRVELVQSTPGGAEVSISEQLIHLKLADKAEESFLSKQDHEWRVLEATAASGPRDRDICTAAPQNGISLSVKGPPDSAKRRGRTIKLTGPSNPLEIEFISMTQTGSYRGMQVDPESVNSTAIDADPQNKFVRMMVAAFVGLNPKGMTMIARDTTIMPQIPGMQAVMCLLFSPIVEFRVDKKRTRYTGALCGLGYDPDEHNYGLLTDHDMEVAFDVDIDDEDIHLINRVRHAINLALGSRGSVAEWGPEAVASKIQAPAREQLMRLLHKSREHKEREFFSNDYKWCQLAHHEIVPPDEDFDCDSLTLLPPHPTVHLASDDNMSVDLQRQHIDELHRIATLHMRGPIKCQLCKVVLPNSQLLAVHLETSTHQRREQKVFDHYTDK